LNQQRLAHVARRNTDRVEPLHDLQGLLDGLHRPRSHRRDLFERRIEEACVVVEIADDGFTRRAHVRGNVYEMKLLDQLLVQRLPARQHILERDFVLGFVLVRLVAWVEVLFPGLAEINLLKWIALAFRLDLGFADRQCFNGVDGGGLG